MSDFLLELRCEEIPARMQAGARADLERLFRKEMDSAGVALGEITVWSTPRRLALIARDLPVATAAVSEEIKGPRVGAPAQALEGFLRKTGLSEGQLVERDGVLYAVTEKPGRATAEVLAEAIPAIVRSFPWPKSMRWGAASLSTESLRWVRPLSGIVAIFGEQLVECEVGGVTSGYATLGHRFHCPGEITIGSVSDYREKMRACHVIVDHAERQDLIRERAKAAAAAEGLVLVEDEGLVIENAGLTEWPVPLLGRFDAAFLEVPPEVIQLTARTNQKYFVCYPPHSPNGEGDHPQGGGGVSSTPADTPPPSSGGSPSPNKFGEDKLANAFVCTANIAAADGGAQIVAGNRKVLAARLADARFFWEQDRKKTLAEHAEGLARITFHEKLGTVADKVERVAKLARWLVEEGIVGARSDTATQNQTRRPGEGRGLAASYDVADTSNAEQKSQAPAFAGATVSLADLAEQAARLCKADLVTEMVGEFPELQGLMGGYYARAEGLDPEVAEAIRDHYKPVGQGDEVPTAPVTVAVSLADKLDSIFCFFSIGQKPTGSKDPFALRRAALGILEIFKANLIELRFRSLEALIERLVKYAWCRGALPYYQYGYQNAVTEAFRDLTDRQMIEYDAPVKGDKATYLKMVAEIASEASFPIEEVLSFFADRLKVQQREAGVRHDLIDAVFALGGEDDLVRLLARVHALQAFVGTGDGANLLAGYKRAANILKKEGFETPSPLQGRGRSGAAAEGVGAVDPAPRQADRPHPNPSPKGEGLDVSIPRDGEEDPFAMVDDPDIAYAMRERLAAQKALSYSPEPAEKALIDALGLAAPLAAAAVAEERFADAMAALASLRAPIDAFFEEVTVNDSDLAKRTARLALLASFRDAVHAVADFSRIEG